MVPTACSCWEGQSRSCFCGDFQAGWKPLSWAFGCCGLQLSLLNSPSLHSVGRLPFPLRPHCRRHIPAAEGWEGPPATLQQAWGAGSQDELGQPGVYLVFLFQGMEAAQRRSPQFCPRDHQGACTVLPLPLETTPHTEWTQRPSCVGQLPPPPWPGCPLGDIYCPGFGGVN